MQSQNHLIQFLAVAAAVLMGSVATPAEAEDVVLTVHNDFYQAVGIWVRSEQNHNPNPWVHQMVPARGDTQIALRSADRFIIVFDADGRRSRSKPVALKEYLAKHPKFVMNVSVTQLAGAAEGGVVRGNGGGGALNVDLVPQSGDDLPPLPGDRLDFEFGADSSGQ